MVNKVIYASNPICLVGGGVLNATDWTLAATVAEGFIGADGGAEAILGAGHVPQAVIGDFDSLSPDIAATLDPKTLYRIDEQDSTDFEKSIAMVDAPIIFAIGFTGGRLDHELAVLHGLVKFAHQPCVLLGEKEVIFHCPPRFRMALEDTDTVSLFPFLPVAGRSTGLKWPIEGLDFAPHLRIGTSNQALGGEMLLDMDGPGMIVLLPRARAESVMSGLLDCVRDRVLWPAL